MKTYTTAPEETHERVAELIRRFYPELEKHKVRICLLMVASDKEGPALKHQGYPAAAVVRAVPQKDRAKDGAADVEITIDARGYEAMDSEERNGLLDHELYHIEVQYSDGGVKLDGQHRPVVKMKKHDRQFGWFDEIARRHGEHSGEVQQARELVEETGQLYLDFTALENIERIAVKKGEASEEDAA
ncbi:hypothetical protein Ga0100231_023795 [Opitutaceae bacterium TAV4]|nr:hypothetical protein Ga0100231_023795 [Opitutaceae bacterium TAV4]RRK00898.1 hypothetical protein Ga0100230_024300 [Opitutaceae bacterium TAV3]